MKTFPRRRLALSSLGMLAEGRPGIEVLFAQPKALSPSDLYDDVMALLRSPDDYCRPHSFKKPRTRKQRWRDHVSGLAGRPNRITSFRQGNR